jgi:hypothetical protein
VRFGKYGCSVFSERLYACIAHAGRAEDARESKKCRHTSWNEHEKSEESNARDT